QILIEKYAVGKCGPEEQLLVEKYFEECQNKPRVFSEESAVIGKRMFQKIVKTIGQKKRRTRQRIGFKVAASLLLLISAGSIIHLYNKEEVYMVKTSYGEKKERSEERRVGKECRSRREPDDEKKKSKKRTTVVKQRSDKGTRE